MIGAKAMGGATQQWGNTIQQTTEAIVAAPLNAVLDTSNIVADAGLSYVDMVIEPFGVSTGALNRTTQRVDSVYNEAAASLEATKTAMASGDAIAVGAGMMGMAMAVAPRFGRGKYSNTQKMDPFYADENKPGSKAWGDLGGDVRFIQALLGHAKLEITGIYTQVSIKQLKDVHTLAHPAKIDKSSNNNHC